MVKFKWYRKEVPRDIFIKQVYGIVFSDEGKILLRLDDNKYKLTGGKPEIKDLNLKETLKREYLEELNVELKEVYYLGFLLVKENNEKYAQVRMIAKINKINKSRLDKDNGKIYKRFMALKGNVKKYLNYSDLAGNKMLDDAIDFANEKYKFKLKNNSEYFV